MSYDGLQLEWEMHSFEEDVISEKHNIISLL
jgi:hypothetical protein